MDSLTQRVFCIGIGGVGVSAVARLLLAEGKNVHGSDIQRTPIIDDLIALGLTFVQREDPNDIDESFGLVVYTDDAGPEHRLRQRATQLAIPQENFSFTLGRLMMSYDHRLCIAGTNGKSTTTALVGLVLAGAALDPTVFVGSRVQEFSGNVRLGGMEFFVAEADEYRDHFLHYTPSIVTLTNIESDHLDYFGTVEKMEQSFASLLSRLPETGMVVYNGDDPVCKKLVAGRQQVLSYGMNEDCDVRITEVTQSSGQQSWTLTVRGEVLGRYILPLPGLFNIMNATAAVATALTAGAHPTSFATTLQAFHGVWRRFQVLNPGSDITVVSDYAHHPTALRGTITGAKAFYPGRRIVAVFQPHHRSRLTSLFDAFAAACDSADVVYIVETYSVTGRDVPEEEVKTATALVQRIAERGVTVEYVDDVTALSSMLPEHLRDGDVVLMMGAGDIWRTAEQLAKHYGTTA